MVGLMTNHANARSTTDTRSWHRRVKLNATTHEITCWYWSDLFGEMISETRTVETYAKSRPQRCPTCSERIR